MKKESGVKFKFKWEGLFLLGKVYLVGSAVIYDVQICKMLDVVNMLQFKKYLV